jgi:anion-transporting  ArsA/GET3 family ATPase
MTPLEERRFVFVTGKGGTGKTTVTAALALALAARGRRVLIALSETKERMSVLFGAPALGNEIRSVAPNISAVKISAESALREYGEMILRSRAVYSAVFENKYVKGFFAAVPGLYQWAILGKAWFHATETGLDGRPRFDVVLFDAPATGHGLDMLRVPKIIVDIAPPGILRRDAEQAWAMFKDDKQSAVVIVTLPEDLPATEAVELATAIDRELELPIANVVVNQVLDFLFTEGERAELLRPRDIPRGEPGDEGLAAAVRRAVRERVHADSMKKIEQGVRARLVTLPRLLVDPSTPDAIRTLSEILAPKMLGVS